ncbi:hypothetical protein M407DRAFT_26482 [Tulasnella calospora MUT 4182]|uniref:CFEM domain-containing protein n=1 Tax=Tulasnella calospora MUT 4182 TaxID=1051891 RepID=A0A0C3QE80_9AGAM|nr:hypothetical protein M407DRAFT_26482 [Tulasnella calospora MUT 4182]
MRFSIAVLFAASLASGYTILKRQTDLPACAQTCYTNTDFSPCNATDIACRCVHPNYLTALQTCVSSSCSEQDAETAALVGVATCQAAGADITNIPACVQTCDQNTQSSTCTPDDLACHCKDTTYIQAIDSCVKASCTGQDLTTAKTGNAAACRAFGVDISSVVGAA